MLIVLSTSMLEYVSEKNHSAYKWISFRRMRLYSDQIFVFETLKILILCCMGAAPISGIIGYNDFIIQKVILELLWLQKA